MKQINSLVSVALIVFISLFLLTFKLGDIPSGIYVDEATTGYNAFSILKTGKDEYGKDFPLAFRFFGSYTPPLYVYLTIIPVALLGLNEFSIRLVSVVSACLMILVIYFFLRTSGYVNKKIIPLLLLLFMITPWNFFYGRIGYELYMGFFLFSLGCLLCWLGLKRKYLIPLGLGILSLATYTAHPQIYSVPIFIAGFLLTFLKTIDKKYFLIGLLLALIIQTPHFALLNTRAFLNKSDLFYSGEILLNAQKINLPQIISIPLSFLYIFFARITTYFSPQSLFFFPDPDLQRSMPEISVFYNWMVIPYLAGIVLLFKKIKEQFVKFLGISLLASVIPPALTHDPFSTQRGLGLLLPLFIIISIGLSVIFENLKMKVFLSIFAGMLMISLIMLWRSYFVLLPVERAAAWNYGFKQLSNFIAQSPEQKFLIDQSRGKPAYIELAFFLKTNPGLLQKASGPALKTDYYNLSQFNPDYQFENLDIRGIDWERDIYIKQVLVGDELAVSDKQAKEHYLKEIFEITDLRGHPVFKGFLTNPEQKCRETNFNSIFCKSLN